MSLGWNAEKWLLELHEPTMVYEWRVDAGGVVARFEMELKYIW